MKRLTDFFGEKDWKTGKMGYNENRKRSKHCCWTVPMRDWNSLSSPKFSVESGVGWTVPMSEQCALYTVINVDEKERKPEQLMSVRQIWIVRVFIFFVVFMHCVLIAKICRYGNRFGDGKCYDRYIKRAWIKIFIVWVFSDSEQILIKRMEFSCYWW